jgi:long-chain acyl-CoA synthetase
MMVEVAARDVHGAGGPALVPRTVAEVLDRGLAADPRREALVGRSGRLSYAELDRLADEAAAALRALGVEPGDRVAAALPNDLDIVVAFHGAMRAGAVWVGVNRALARPEKAYILSDSGASVLLCDPETADQLEGERGRLPALREVVVAEGGAGSCRWATAGPRVGRPGRAQVDPFAPAGIAYTSGTTGYPKGVVHSQHNLLLPGAVTVATRGYGPDLRKGDCLPLTILNLLVLTTLLVAQAGGCCVVMDRVDPVGVADWVRSERVTVWNGVPAILYSMTADEAIAAFHLASLEEVWTGGGDCPEALRRRFEEKFGRPVRATYGLTEAPTLVAIEGVDAPHVEGSSGTPLPHLEVTVRDEQGRPLEAGATGEICVGAAREGPWAGAYRPMLGYWQRPEATAEALAGGVLHTGDLGYLDASGQLFVVDRKTLVIVRGGANVYPAEVERVLLAIPGVAGAAVVGVPDERLGERVVAAVELAPGTTLSPEALRQACLAELARYKVPERFVFVGALPRNAMGKVARAEVAALAAAALGAPESAAPA